MTAPAIVRQADLKRAIRATKDCGLEVHGVRVTPSGYEIVTVKIDPPAQDSAHFPALKEYPER